MHFLSFASSCKLNSTVSCFTAALVWRDLYIVVWQFPDFRDKRAVPQECVAVAVLYQLAATNARL